MHKEKAYTETAQGDIIRYKYADSLQIWIYAGKITGFQRTSGKGIYSFLLCSLIHGGSNSHKCELKQKMRKKYALKEN